MKVAFQWLCENFVTYLRAYVLWQVARLQKEPWDFHTKKHLNHAGKEKHEDREFNLLVSKTKYFLLLNWNSQIENVVETKNVSFPFAFSHVKRMFLFGVPLRFWFKRLLTSGKELSPQPWQSELSGGRVVWWLGECREVGPGLATTVHLWPEGTPALGV